MCPIKVFYIPTLPTVLELVEEEKHFGPFNVGLPTPRPGVSQSWKLTIVTHNFAMFGVRYLLR